MAFPTWPASIAMSELVCFQATLLLPSAIHVSSRSVRGPGSIPAQPASS